MFRILVMIISLSFGLAGLPVLALPITPGDVDQSGTVNAADLVLLVQQLAGNANPVMAEGFNTGDCDRNGSETARDLLLLQSLLSGSISRIQAGGDLWAAGSIAGKLFYVPAGTFLQGDLPDDPCGSLTPFFHTLTLNLAVMETPVTQDMWTSLQAADPAGFPLSNPSYFNVQGIRPVENMTWAEIMLFANRLSVYQGLAPCYYLDAGFATPITVDNYTNGYYFCDWEADGYRLPSEGEREYFCRAGTTSPFWVSFDFTSCDNTCNRSYPALEAVAWYCAVSGYRTHPVGMLTANPWNLKDVHGNVFEECWDWWDPYPAGDQTDYRGPATAPAHGYGHIIRGGSYGNGAASCRSAKRAYFGYVGKREPSVGFRLVRTIR